ncbi:MAG: amidohydrolase family protein [Planctomycetota bacterium]|nr:amidohydrolase family protein [Planctomycetota bacterium]
MILDLHVHVSAQTQGHGKMSRQLMASVPFRFMRWKFGISGDDKTTEVAVAAKLASTLQQTQSLDAAVILAFDAVYDHEGCLDDANTHLYVSNAYVIGLCKQFSKMRFGASVHPYRKDAVAEIERCVAEGAVLMKWLPIVQNFNPADERCIPFYEVLAHHRLPLLSHTGGEQSLPRLDDSVADPMLLLPAIQRGVTVIAAHCGTRSHPRERDYLPEFVRLAQDHENFYGDTAALNLPARWYAYDTILTNPTVREKLVHGSDWPIPAIPSVRHLGLAECADLLMDANWMRRDILIKEKLGFDAAYWHRAAKVVGLSNSEIIS